jgi:Gram-negative bacterial TonB protein C-terminal
MRKQGILSVGLALLSSFFFCYAFARRSQPNLPTVIGAAVPLYPPLARAASMQGTVTLVVVTNGDRVQSTKVVNGPPLLSAAAESNIRTWTFVEKSPQTFDVTYRYVLSDRCEGNPTIKIDFPTSVAICFKPNPPID